MKKKSKAPEKVSPRIGKGGQPIQVAYVRDEISNLIPQYYLIRDAVEGEPAIKGLMGGISSTAGAVGGGGLPLTVTNIVMTRAMRYLPMPNAQDRSEQNMERYRSYVTRAVWYGVTARTLEGMSGQVFLRDPQVELPKTLDILTDDADGSGLSLNQTAYRAVRHTLAYGRTGMLVDYPVVNGPATKAQIANGDVRPTLTVYHPWDIINWRVESRGARKILTLVVLKEVIDEEGDDGFQLTTFEQYRVLRIDPTSGDHVVELYRQSGSGFEQSENLTPRDASGNTLKEIPFHFIGSENNGIPPNRPPLYDLAAMNIAHYRNSADYEEACFIAGQPTPVLSGLSEDWVKNQLNGVVTLGSRAAIPLPVGAKAELLQARENSMPIEAMKQKEEQMVALGAKLVQKQLSARSATEQIIETTSESSTLANCSINVSHVMQWALGIAQSFVTKDKSTIKYVLNKDFDLTSMTADDQNAVIKQWQSAAITFPEMRSVLKKAGIATEDDDAAKAAIQADVDKGMIPDPSGVAASMTRVPDAKGASDAGGPQPKPIRRQPKPQGSA